MARRKNSEVKVKVGGIAVKFRLSVALQDPELLSQTRLDNHQDADAHLSLPLVRIEWLAGSGNLVGCIWGQVHLWLRMRSLAVDQTQTSSSERALSLESGSCDQTSWPCAHSSKQFAFV